MNKTGFVPKHLYSNSYASDAKNNIENFIGTAQIPLGIAGPLTIKGQYARGDFFIPLATSEGTLVASYNRGMKIINLCGGIKTTVIEDYMQRAPVFIFESARECVPFIEWLDKNFENIKDQAESTSKFCKLISIEKYISNKFAFIRFNFHTGDAAGQNMVTKATSVACDWIINNFDKIQDFYLESNFAVDKKPSHINILHTRGKRVTAEMTVPKEIVIKHLRTDPEKLHRHGNIGNIGSFMAGTLNNGLHSTNGITAMFIATGQDVANVAESSMGIVYNEILPDGSIYASLTIPSLICATFGGGTGLPTQKECLQLLDCEGAGYSKKLAEIICAVAFAGEISLSSAISSLEWVTSHEKMGRNR